MCICIYICIHVKMTDFLSSFFFLLFGGNYKLVNDGGSFDSYLRYMPVCQQ